MPVPAIYQSKISSPAAHQPTKNPKCNMAKKKPVPPKTPKKLSPAKRPAKTTPASARPVAPAAAAPQNGKPAETKAAAPPRLLPTREELKTLYNRYTGGAKFDDHDKAFYFVLDVGGISHAKQLVAHVEEVLAELEELHYAASDCDLLRIHRGCRRKNLLFC
jgi:hypothetical protein